MIGRISGLNLISIGLVDKVTGYSSHQNIYIYMPSISHGHVNILGKNFCYYLEIL